MDRLKTMDTFVRIVKSGSLAKAADLLGVSRGVVSKHLQQLEEHLGVRLLKRTTRQTALTEIGSEYYATCTRILAEIEEEERAVSQFQVSPTGTLKLIAPMSFGNLYLGPIVAEFIAMFPEIKVTLVLSDVSFMPVDLIDKGFDLAIRLTEVHDTSIIARKVGNVRSVVCASAAYLERHGRPRVPADLTRHNCLVHRKIAPDSVWRFEGADGRVEVKVAGALVTNSVMAIRSAILAGVGIGILPTYCVGSEFADGTAEALLSDFVVADRPIYVLYADSRFLPRKIKVFVDFLADRLRGPIAGVDRVGKAEPWERIA